jgi:HEAT repeat protein
MFRLATLTIAATLLIAANIPSQPPFDPDSAKQAQILSHEQQKEVIDTLVQVLSDSDPVMHSHAVAGLLKIGEAAVPSLIPLLESKDRAMKLEVAKIFFLMGDMELHRKEALLALTKEVRTTDDSEFRRMAVMAMSNLAQAARVTQSPGPMKDKK